MNKAQQGMTLLEVLVALMIFSVGCLAVIRTTSQQARHLGALEKNVIAGWVADNQLAQITLDRIRPSALWQQGQEKMADNDWYWRYRGLQTTDPQVYAVDIEVADNPAFSGTKLQLRTWMK